MSEEQRKRIVAKCHEYKEIGPLDDGYQYFWIKDRGAASAFDLRCIADELDRLNASHDSAMRQYIIADGGEVPLTECMGGRDGDCFHSQCPQLKNRMSHCPLDAAATTEHTGDK